MEPVDAGQPFMAVVDYAHTPDAVATALTALRGATRGRLITVLGCGGDRDPGKRTAMGAAAAHGSDVLVVTDDNPRSEDPAAIRAAVLAGVAEVPKEQRAEVLEVGDRREAIATAAGLARPGDTVLLAGKGHETGQEVAGQVHPFDDRAVLREVLTQLGTRA
jgi:UDP-N-acetylmuramoyl-L-alanyl-D-glutamate--2,6-diaminopimelate ligase